MNAGELAGKLKTPGIFLFCYFVVPPLLNFALGPLDALWGRAHISDIAQAAFGVAALRKLLLLEGDISSLLESWLGQFRQPREKTTELAGRMIFTSAVLCAAALLLPPLGRLLPRWLAVLANLGGIGYVFYSAYGLWQLYAPFTANPPDAPDPEPEPEAPRAPEVRCPGCGQKLGAGDEFCTFCRRQVDRPAPPPGATGRQNE